jgi:predicted transcriptional regulator
MQNGEVLFTFRQNIESDRLAPAPLLFAPLLQVWLDSNKRRSRLRIYVEILDILKEGAMTPYEISFRLRLNQKRTREYLEFLQKNSFVDCGEKEDGKRVFEITENGKAFVENLRSVLDPNRSILDLKENSGT